MIKKKAAKKIARSSVSGKIVSKKYAKDNPATTQVSKVKPKPNISKLSSEIVTAVINELYYGELRPDDRARARKNVASILKRII